MKSMAAKSSPKSLLDDVREMVLALRRTVAQSINSAQVVLYWKMGVRIRTDLLKEKRAEYGGEILQTLSAKLTVEFGGGRAESDENDVLGGCFRSAADSFDTVATIKSVERQGSVPGFGIKQRPQAQRRREGMKGRKAITKSGRVTTGLSHEIRELILSARQGVARGVNAALGDAALANRGPYPDGHSERKASGVWTGDFADAVGKIDA